MMQIRKVNEIGWPPARSIAHLQNLGQEKDCSQSSYLGIWCSKEDGFPVLLHLLFGNTFPIFRFTQYSFVFLYLKRKGRVHSLPYNSLEYLASDRTAWKNTLLPQNTYVSGSYQTTRNLRHFRGHALANQISLLMRKWRNQRTNNQHI